MLFKHFARNVVELKTSKRQHSDQDHLKSLLNKLCNQDDKNTMTLEDVKHLMCYNIDDTRYFTQQEKLQLMNQPDTLFLFANKEPRNVFNMKKLFTQHSKSNPVALICPQITGISGKNTRTSIHFAKDDCKLPVRICRGAKVQLKNRNFRPEYGLFNGSMGEVKEIIYEPLLSPVSGDLPTFVLVDFPKYTGPPFLIEHPTYVPIPTVSKLCIHHCCQIQFLPLELCYAKTIHTFQGQNAGPVLPGQPPNAVARIIVDPGTKQFEGNNPGLSYTIVSRATTMGKTKLHSAIYFHGENSNVQRFTNLHRQASGHLYKLIFQRDQWVARLKRGYVKKLPTEHEIQMGNTLYYRPNNLQNFHKKLTF